MDYDLTLEDLDLLIEAIEAKEAQVASSGMMSGLFTSMMAESPEQMEERTNQASKFIEDKIREAREQSIPIKAKLITAKSTANWTETLKKELTKDDINYLIDSLVSWERRHASMNMTTKVTSTLMGKMFGKSSDELHEGLEKIDEDAEARAELIKNEGERSVLLQSKLLNLEKGVSNA